MTIGPAPTGEESAVIILKHRGYTVIAPPTIPESDDDAYESRCKVFSKVDWEGGLPDVLEYGLTASDMPAGDTELREAWARMDALWAELSPLVDRVNDMIQDRDKCGCRECADG
ncbi:hypothetical protein [Streptomyces sp. NPDC003952]